jgi:hypothetical protein
MNENNKSFYPSDMFEFIHHPKYGYRNLKGLRRCVNSSEVELILQGCHDDVWAGGILLI